MIAFRVDGNINIGMGHIMRCLSIANAAKDMGEESLFILSSEDCREIIKPHGHHVNVLKSDYAKLELGDILPAFDIYNLSAMFVDSYYVTPEYMETMHKNCKNRGCKLIYIDDRCCFPYSCDVLLNYNIFSKSEYYKKLYAGNNEPMFLFGASYAPLRKEFQNADKRDTAEKSPNIFVSTGGADAEHLTLDLVEEAMSDLAHVFHFVVGAMNSDKVAIKNKAMNCKNIIIHENVSRMDKLMHSCGVAISAAGSTLYELCATQTPTVTYIIADNQIPAAEEFDARGIMKNCGDIRDRGSKRLAKRLIEESIKLVDNIDERKRISELMEPIVDGKGARRIIKSVLNKPDKIFS